MSPAGLYRELAPSADLHEAVRCIWYRRISADEAVSPIRVVPDGCLDLIWSGGKVSIAGPDRRAWLGHIPAGTELVGVRFRPGAAPALLGISALDLVGQRVAADALVHLSLDRLAAEEDAHGAVLALEELIRDRVSQSSEPDGAVRYAAQRIIQAGGESSLSIARLAADVGLSERQLHRRSQESLGYGLKTFARVVRFQRFVRSAQWPHRSIAELAAACGYADQAHLTREVRELAGVTPGLLVRTAQPASGA